MPLTDSQLAQVMPNLNAAHRAEYLPPLNAAMHEFDISTGLARLQMFLAQIAHESGGLVYWHEIASGAEYEGRQDLGNTQPGDGRRFRGRGPLQLTGRANYVKYGHLLGVDFVTNPDLAQSVEYGFRIAGLFWKLHGLNEIADADTEEAFRKITRRINGGLNGYESRKAYWEKAKKAIK